VYEARVGGGNTHIGLGKRHLQVVEQRLEKGPGAVHRLQRGEMRRISGDVVAQRAADGVPTG